MIRVIKNRKSELSCLRHLKELSKKDISYSKHSITKLDDWNYQLEYFLFDIPMESVIEMASLIKQFSNMFDSSSDTDELEHNGISWSYLHKLNRRVQFRLNNVTP